MPVRLLVLAFFPLIVYSQDELNFVNCTGDVYPPGSPFEPALRSLLDGLTTLPPKSPSLYSDISTSQISGFAQCRPDASKVACANCLLVSSSKFANAACERSLSASVYQDLCFLLYSNESIPASLDETLVGFTNSWLNSPNPANFSRQVTELMGKISWDASMSMSRFAAGVAETDDPLKQKIYGMVWCKIDLMTYDCLRCLLSAVGKLSFTTVGGRIYERSCFLRFEVYTFVDPSFIKSVTSPELLGVGARSQNITIPEGASGQSGGSSKEKALLTVAISEGVALVLSSLLFLVVLFRKKRTFSIASINHNADDEEMRRDKPLLLDFSVISSATSNFSEIHKLGEGGFGQVYKGVLNNGEEIAVKRLSKTSGQGIVELENEVAFVAKLQHRNLVRLLGCCLEKTEKLLVYEFLPNTSLDKHLFDSDRKIKLDWGTRYKIIDGIAQGLLYLHEDSRVRIIHCDMKASNVLLDGNMNPKISDFGLAKLFGMDEAEGNTNRIAGTYGYMAPEYALRGLYSTKSDVYSYGVLVLEIVAGRRNIYLDESVDATDLLRFVWQKWKDGHALQAVDESLGDRFMPQQALRCIQIGLLCIQEDPAQRPSIASLVVMLSSYSCKLPEPLMPTFLR